MQILLVAINAKYIHSSLAIRSLKKYSHNLAVDINLAEYTINNQTDSILGDIYKKSPDVVCFSCYLWNIAMVRTLARNLKKILPKIRIFLGGPEVSYDAEEFLQSEPAIDLIMIGEGEATFYDLAKALIENKSLIDIVGTAYRENNKIVLANNRPPLALDDIPFVYDSLEGFTHRICYYETQRGCPYSCQYCLSSVEKGIRFLSKERVQKDLQFFLDANVRQVKFVDRTFNANKAHALNIWRYLIAHDNGHTNFHMEITADILDEECVLVLANARVGLFQFEIGVQTTNEQTMQAIQRKVDFNKLTHVVNQIKALGNIHQHLDLIAGLPFENYQSFSKSFNDVYALSPEQLQLGFLKLLKGAGLRRDASYYGIAYQEEPVYEVLSTPALSFDELLQLKQIEELVETYYNSGKTPKSISLAVSLFETPFAFYEAFGYYWEEKGYFDVLHSKMELYFIFYEFAGTHPILYSKQSEIKDALKYDLYLNDNIRSLPEWIGEHDWEKERRWAFYNSGEEICSVSSNLAGRNAKQLSKTCNLVFFNYDIENNFLPTQTAILFDYSSKDNFFGHCLHYPVTF